MGLLAAIQVMPVWARDDWELWTELRWKYPLSERLVLQGVTSARFRGDFGEWYRHYDEIGLGYRWQPWLRLETTYHWNVSDRPNTHDNVYEHRLYVSATPQVTLAGFQLEHRHRILFSHINGVDDWRYRSRVKASRPLGEDRWWQVKPFVWDEAFYSTRAGEWFRNRAALGVERALSERVSVETFYLIESNRAGRDWDEFHALGFAANLAF